MNAQQSEQSELEATFRTQLRQLGVPQWEEQYKAIAGRQYKFDFAWKQYDLLVEINGGTWVASGRNTGSGKKMGHQSGAGIAHDYEKGNWAAFYGYKTMSFDCKMVKSGNAALFIRSYFQSIGVMP